jgi:hypothetical protein
LDTLGRPRYRMVGTTLRDAPAASNKALLLIFSSFARRRYGGPARQKDLPRETRTTIEPGTNQ